MSDVKQFSPAGREPRDVEERMVRLMPAFSALKERVNHPRRRGGPPHRRSCNTVVITDMVFHPRKPGAA